MSEFPPQSGQGPIYSGEVVEDERGRYTMAPGMSGGSDIEDAEIIPDVAGALPAGESRPDWTPSYPVPNVFVTVYNGMASDDPRTRQAARETAMWWAPEVGAAFDKYAEDRKAAEQAGQPNENVAEEVVPGSLQEPTKPAPADLPEESASSRKPFADIYERAQSTDPYVRQRAQEEIRDLPEYAARAYDRFVTGRQVEEAAARLSEKTGIDLKELGSMRGDEGAENIDAPDVPEAEAGAGNPEPEPRPAPASGPKQPSEGREAPDKREGGAEPKDHEVLTAAKLRHLAAALAQGEVAPNAQAVIAAEEAYKTVVKRLQQPPDEIKRIRNQEVPVYTINGEEIDLRILQIIASRGGADNWILPEDERRRLQDIMDIKSPKDLTKNQLLKLQQEYEDAGNSIIVASEGRILNWHKQQAAARLQLSQELMDYRQAPVRAAADARHQQAKEAREKADPLMAEARALRSDDENQLQERAYQQALAGELRRLDPELQQALATLHAHRGPNADETLVRNSFRRRAEKIAEQYAQEARQHYRDEMDRQGGLNRYLVRLAEAGNPEAQARVASIHEGEDWDTVALPEWVTSISHLQEGPQVPEEPADTPEGRPRSARPQTRRPNLPRERTTFYNRVREVVTDAAVKLGFLRENSNPAVRQQERRRLMSRVSGTLIAAAVFAGLREETPSGRATRNRGSAAQVRPR